MSNKSSVYLMFVALMLGSIIYVFFGTRLRFIVTCTVLLFATLVYTNVASAKEERLMVFSQSSYVIDEKGELLVCLKSPCSLDSPHSWSFLKDVNMPGFMRTGHTIKYFAHSNESALYVFFSRR